MTKIYINIEADTPADMRTALAGLLGTTALTQEFAGNTEGGTTTSVAYETKRDTTDNADASATSRERGKPAAGRARRTKEEIAEDEAADAADAARVAAGAETGATVADRQISSGTEDRVDPDNPADAAQDADDEAAETATAKASSDKPLTHDDVRNALGRYVKKFGMDAAQQDGPAVITLMFGEGKAKVSDIPDTQEDLGKAVAGIEEMIIKNPFKRELDL